MGVSSIEARRVRFTVLDFETTGAVAGHAVEPWQVGLVGVSGGRVSTTEYFESLLRVGDRPFNRYAPGRHALLRHELAYAPTLPDLWPRLQGWVCGRPLVAHNVGTERGILSSAAPLHKFGPWVDTLTLARHAYPDLASKALTDMISELKLEAYVSELCPGRKPHDALYDAFACAALLEHFLHLPGWERVTVEALSGPFK